MGQYFTRDYLYRMGNKIPVPSLIKHLEWPTKYCDPNFNTIDFTMLIEQVDFVIAIGMLDPLLPPPSSR